MLGYSCRILMLRWRSMQWYRRSSDSRRKVPLCLSVKTFPPYSLQGLGGVLKDVNIKGVVFIVGRRSYSSIYICLLE
jgi:hypothetical protein